ncbi:MAG: DUF192 domain-containing protein, partial [Thermoplasmata archaeon]|nr:DUF192 domain-containing protein [Thermoplasmata archaeon]
MNKQNNDTTIVSRTIEFRVEEPGEPYALVTFGTDGSNVTFTCEIADDSAERSEGLMYRTELASDHGMLFVFDHTQEVQFWMKNTLIPLDIIFIDNNGVVLNIAEADPEPGVSDSLLTRYASLG